MPTCYHQLTASPLTHRYEIHNRIAQQTNILKSPITPRYGLSLNRPPHPPHTHPAMTPHSPRCGIKNRVHVHCWPTRINANPVLEEFILIRKKVLAQRVHLSKLASEARSLLKPSPPKDAHLPPYQHHHLTNNDDTSATHRLLTGRTSGSTCFSCRCRT